MTEQKIILVRSPRELIEKGLIGYGWQDIDFSAYNDIDDLLKNGFDGRNIGRKKNQITRFFNLKEWDLVVVPFFKSIAIAKVIGRKSFDSSVSKGSNQVSVSYLGDSKGNIFISREKYLSTALQSRLRIRMSNADLKDFSDEILKLVEALDKGEALTWETKMVDKEAKLAEKFKTDLLARLGSGKGLGLSTGGDGLEKLIQEILIIQGYSADIPSKKAVKGIADVDIIATRKNIFSEVERILVQVKHHRGTTSPLGVKQLFEYKPEEKCSRKILITTAGFSNAVISKAEDKDGILMVDGIQLVDGDELVEWIYENIDQLSASTRAKIGVSMTPTLIY